jgi:hypothetical protein
VIILKASKGNLFVSSVSFVFWYHSPNFLDTPRITYSVICYSSIVCHIVFVTIVLSCLQYREYVYLHYQEPLASAHKQHVQALCFDKYTVFQNVGD